MARIGTWTGVGRARGATLRDRRPFAGPPLAANCGRYRLTLPAQAIYLREAVQPQEEFALANHLTPTELADEVQMQRQEVIAKCVEMGIPIFHGRIDKTLFMTSLRHAQRDTADQKAA